jgi:hypothetical protein
MFRIVKNLIKKKLKNIIKDQKAIEDLTAEQKITPHNLHNLEERKVVD